MFRGNKKKRICIYLVIFDVLRYFMSHYACKVNVWENKIFYRKINICAFVSL